MKHTCPSCQENFIVPETNQNLDQFLDSSITVCAFCGEFLEFNNGNINKYDISLLKDTSAFQEMSFVSEIAKRAKVLYPDKPQLRRKILGNITSFGLTKKAVIAKLQEAPLEILIKNQEKDESNEKINEISQNNERLNIIMPVSPIFYAFSFGLLHRCFHPAHDLGEMFDLVPVEREEIIAIVFSIPMAYQMVARELAGEMGLNFISKSPDKNFPLQGENVFCVIVDPNGPLKDIVNQRKLEEQKALEYCRLFFDENKHKYKDNIPEFNEVYTGLITEFNGE